MKKKPTYISLKELKRKLLSNPGVKKAYDDLEPEYQLARQIIEARIKKKISQAQLAIQANTGQAVISRLEGMNGKPSISLLERIARALGTKFQITIQ